MSFWLTSLVVCGAGIVFTSMKIVSQSNAYVVERLGAYKETWSTGPHFKVPLIDRIRRVVTLKEQVVDFAPQPVITKDNVTMQIDTVVYFQVFDARLYTYSIDYPTTAIENLVATTLRNIIGELELDQTLISRDTINFRIQTVLDEATVQWGIKVKRVELRNILPPREIRDAMEKQMKAERERREVILRAEGEKKSAILIAEGNKEAKILSAQADKEAAILAAQAKKETLVCEADGEAEAILKVQAAVAKGLKLLSESNPSSAVIALKSLEALTKLADGKSTKIIIPSNIQGIAGLVTTANELLTKPE